MTMVMMMMEMVMLLLLNGDCYDADDYDVAVDDGDDDGGCYDDDAEIAHGSHLCILIFVSHCTSYTGFLKSSETGRFLPFCRNFTFSVLFL